MEKHLLIAIIATICLIAYVLLDLLINEPLWNFSVRMTISMQEEKFFGETFMYQFFTILAFIPALFGVAAFVIMDCKLNALLYFSVCCFSVATNEMLKSIYH